MKETIETIHQWRRETFPNATIDGAVQHILEEWVEWFDARTVDDKAEEAADLIILLLGYLDLLGRPTAVDDKMAVCRARSWNILPDGTGRHK